MLEFLLFLLQVNVVFWLFAEFSTVILTRITDFLYSEIKCFFGSN
jgi:hypothetical protein